MAKKYFVLHCLLLQGFIIIGSENQVSLHKSTDQLNCANPLSQSQELVREAKEALRNIYYSTPCYPTKGTGTDNYKPLPPLPYYHSDCP